MDGHFKIGFAIWGYRGWIGDFFPKGSAQGELLGLYAQRVTSVEGNTTFYAVPSAETVARWADQVPEGFEFCPKVPKEITHEGALWPRASAASDFLIRMQGLGDRLGPCFVQLPPSYDPRMMPDLLRFLEAWPRDEAPLAVEVRHPMWYVEPHATALEEALERLGVGRAILDTRPIYNNKPDAALLEACRKPNVPTATRATAGLGIIRYISHPDLPLNEPYLHEWARRAAAWLAQGHRVYFFVHCPVEAQSPAILRRFYEILDEQGAPVPPLPWHSVKEPPTQMTLF